jgi:hypothetical protein
MDGGNYNPEINLQQEMIYTRSKMKPGFQIVAGTYSYM